MKTFVAFLTLTCLFGCSQTAVEEQAEPQPACVPTPRSNAVCYALFDPVCGCDGRTYSNNCEAEAVGIKQYTKGACAGK
ncbi:MAG TPA: hypothetical protein VGA96_15180 [Fibrella sp.]